MSSELATSIVDMSDYPTIFDSYEVRNSLGEFVPLSIGFRQNTNDRAIFDSILSDCYGVGDLPFEPDDVVIDIGSHVGYFSLLLAARYPVQVYSYEALFENIELQRYLLESNSAHFMGAVSVFHKAVWGNFPHKMNFFYNDDSESGRIHKFIGSHGTSSSDSNSYRIVVDTMTLLDIFKTNNIEHCKVLKCDAEGSEWYIFNDEAFDLVKSSVDYLAIEIHKGHFQGVEVTVEMFEDKLKDVFRPIVCAATEPQTILFERI